MVVSGRGVGVLPRGSTGGLVVVSGRGRSLQPRSVVCEQAGPLAWSERGAQDQIRYGADSFVLIPHPSGGGLIPVIRSNCDLTRPWRGAHGELTAPSPPGALTRPQRTRRDTGAFRPRAHPHQHDEPAV